MFIPVSTIFSNISTLAEAGPAQYKSKLIGETKMALNLSVDYTDGADDSRQTDSRCFGIDIQRAKMVDVSVGWDIWSGAISRLRKCNQKVESE